MRTKSGLKRQIGFEGDASEMWLCITPKEVNLTGVILIRNDWHRNWEYAWIKTIVKCDQSSHIVAYD